MFHLRSPEGQYKLNFSAAQRWCEAEGASLATYTQLSYAQQVSEHISDQNYSQVLVPGLSSMFWLRTWLLLLVPGPCSCYWSQVLDPAASFRP